MLNISVFSVSMAICKRALPDLGSSSLMLRVAYCSISDNFPISPFLTDLTSLSN
jgi:hypothetical protein